MKTYYGTVSVTEEFTITVEASNTENAEWKMRCLAKEVDFRPDVRDINIVNISEI